ncbi:MAG: uridine phosphorylase [Clostridiales bacterium]|nr:uridine phosphorylase [Clostridiales bacterium]
MKLNDNNELFHIGLKRNEGARLAIICGDPERVKSIAQLMDEPMPLAVRREYTSYTAKLDGERVIIISHGIGGPSTAICVEELKMLGVETIIRVGTCGGMAMKVCAEDVVIAQAAIRAEGTSREYLPIEFPAAADFDVTSALVSAAEKLGKAYHVGVVHCKDSFYGQHSPARMPVADELQTKWKAWISGGALASEMETASLFCVASTLGIRAGAVLRAIWNQERANASMIDEVEADELAAARIAVEAGRSLLKQLPHK